MHIDRGCADLPQTKNGSPRWAPLSTRAIAALKGLKRASEGVVFPIALAALDKCLKRACERAGIVDFRPHDLRHTATTRLAVKGPNVIELAAVTGHRSLQMLKRYFHPSPEMLAEKIA